MSSLKKLLYMCVIVVSYIFSYSQAFAFAGGTGTSIDPYQITTPEELASLSNYLGSGNSGKYFKLMNNINLNVAPYNTGAGWTPIGTSANAFYGKFDGNYKTISELFIYSPASTHMALFGKTASGSIVENVILTDVNVEGYNYGVASLVGHNGGTVQNSGVDGGSVKATMRSGGLVGYNAGVLQRSYSTGVTVTQKAASSDCCMGGLVGGNESGGTINNSYSRSSVVHTSGGQGALGGAIGNTYTAGSMSYIYAASSITSLATLPGSQIGGLAGTGYVSATNAYWDTTIGYPTSPSGTGKTSLQMKDQSTYSGWDFSTIWNIDANTNGGYPFLRWLSQVNPDTTAPSIEITHPTADEIVSGASVQVVASSTDDVAVAGVTFFIDNVAQGSEDVTSPYEITYDSTATSSGIHSVFAVARDSSNNYATSTTISFSIDNTIPNISSVIATTSSSSVYISWESDKQTSSKIYYGLTAEYGLSTLESDISSRVTTHNVTISNLISCTIYQYQVEGSDAGGNSSTSTNKTFITSGCAGETDPGIHTFTDLVNPASATSTLSIGVEDNNFQASFPEGFTDASSSSVVIQIKALDKHIALESLGKPSQGLTGVSDYVFDVKALVNATTTLDSFDVPVVITYTYTDADISGLDESTVWLYHFHDDSWSALDNCILDMPANTISCTTPNFSVFGLFGSAPTTVSVSSTVLQTSIPQTLFSGTIFGCKDSNAVNYNYFSESKPELCIYTPAKQISKKRFEIRNLSIGMVGPDVKELQKYLNEHGFTVASKGPGSSGHETTKFGSATKAALIKFQKAKSIKPTSGFFGSLTRAHIALYSL